MSGTKLLTDVVYASISAENRKTRCRRQVLLIVFYGKKIFGNYSYNFDIYKAVFLKVDETRSGYSTEDKQRRFWCICLDALKGICKQSPDRPITGPEIPGGWGSQISRQSARVGGKVVQPYGPAAFTPPPPPPPPHELFLVLISVRGLTGQKEGIII
jgi:hypothetical protein